MSDQSDLRWHVMAVYRSANGPVDVHFDVEEIDEVQDLIERGPDWNSILRVEITLNRKTAYFATVEAAA